MVTIRPFNPGDERELFKVFFSAVHLIASRNYSPAQVDAWAPRDLDTGLWRSKMHEINPFVAELRGRVVGYADLQTTGYIDHFYVSGECPRQGIGTSLMLHLIHQANSRALPVLFPQVSRTAQPFFNKFDFSIIEHRQPIVRGIVTPNALMRRRAA